MWVMTMGERFVVPINDRGGVTVPQPLRRVYGITGGEDVILELHGVAEDSKPDPADHDDQSGLTEFESGKETDDNSD